MKTAIIILITLAIPGLLRAQSADTPIYGQNSTSIGQEKEDIIKQALLAREQTKALTKEQIEQQMLNPVPEPIKLLPPRTAQMSTEEIAEHARATNLRVGYCYKCLKCEHWHINLAGGYAIAEDVIVTCDHVLATTTKMSEGFMIAVDQDGKVACATAVIARSASLDAAIIKVDGTKFKPVPLNADIRQGAASYCFSQPLQQRGYFSSGIVNRFFWNDGFSGKDLDSLDDLLNLRINLSTDWAPGSSGSPLFDQAGNAISHVSMIAGLGSGKTGSAQITLHIGVPVKPIQKLISVLDQPEEIKRIANLAPKGKKESSVTPRKADPEDAPKP